MTRTRILLLLVLITGLAAPLAPAHAQVDQQQIVNRATATVERLKGDSAGFRDDFLSRLNGARAILIVPDFYRGGFIIGAQYGTGVLLARDSTGKFGTPGFYSVAGGSLGLQAGVQDTSVAFLIMTDRGLSAILSNQFKMGADIGINFAVWGAGMGAGSTSALGADIVAFALSPVGLYGGASFEGAVVSARDSYNRAYYGQDIDGASVVMKGVVNNPEASRLRDTLGN